MPPFDRFLKQTLEATKNLANETAKATTTAGKLAINI